MLAAKLATKLVGSNSFTKFLVQEYFSLHFPFFFVGGEHWLSPPCSVARAQLLPTCTVPGKLFSVQGWRGRGTQVLQAWEPEQAELTALRKVFAIIMMTIWMMITASQWLSAEEHPGPRAAFDCNSSPYLVTTTPFLSLLLQTTMMCFNTSQAVTKRIKIL